MSVKKTKILLLQGLVFKIWGNQMIRLLMYYVHFFFTAIINCFKMSLMYIYNVLGVRICMPILGHKLMVNYSAYYSTVRSFIFRWQRLPQSDMQKVTPCLSWMGSLLPWRKSMMWLVAMVMSDPLHAFFPTLVWKSLKCYIKKSSKNWCH